MLRRASPALLLVCALVLGSCSDDAPPPQGMPIDGKVDVPKSGGKPDIPKKLSLTESGAKFFVGYWIDAYNWALKSGRTKLVRSMTSTDCLACENLFTAVEDAHQGKAKVQTLGVDTVPMDVSVDKRARTAKVKFFVMRNEVKIKHGKKKAQKIKAGVSPIRFDLVRVRKTWQVTDLELVPVKQGNNGKKNGKKDGKGSKGKN